MLVSNEEGHVLLGAFGPDRNCFGGDAFAKTSRKSHISECVLYKKELTYRTSTIDLSRKQDEKGPSKAPEDDSEPRPSSH